MAIVKDKGKKMPIIAFFDKKSKAAKFRKLCAE